MGFALCQLLWMDRLLPVLFALLQIRWPQRRRTQNLMIPKC